MTNRINPWEHRHAEAVNWKTKSSYFSWLRGQIRRIWADNPLRKEWKKSKLRPVTMQEKIDKVFHSSTKNVAQCYVCGEWLAGSKLEVDHLVGESSCVDFDTSEEFLWHCAADNPDNWGLICKPCHKNKTYAERYGLTMEEAKATKKAIEIEKEKRVEGTLKKLGITPASNSKLRRKQLVEAFMKEGERDDQ